MLYAVSIYDLDEEKQFEKGYEIIFRDIGKAFFYAYKKSCGAPFSRRYVIERMPEAVAQANGLEDLIES